MATLSSPGVGSGLDVNSIVTQLVAVERKPIDALQTKASTIQTQLSSFGLLQSYAGNIRDISDRLAAPAFWTGTTASSADASSVAASSTATAASGSYAVQVNTLAQAQGLYSGGYTGSTATVGSGTLHIELGAWNDGLTSFSADATKTAVDVTIGPGENTLDGIKAKINAAKAGVTASIVTDSSGSRLVLQSNATGAKSAVRITATDDDGNNTDGTGLSALAFNPAVSGGQMTQSQAARDTQATINGMPVTSTTNSLANVIDGVTLTLSKQTTTPVTVTVGLDTATIKKAISDFAKAYSDMAGYITQQTKYDATTKRAAPLQGDQPTLALQSSLKRIFLGSSSAPGVFSRLSDIGVQLQKDGSLTVNDAKLNTAMANPAEVARLFTNTSDNPDQQGFAVRAAALTRQMVGSSGAITSRTAGLRDSIARNTADQQKLEDRVSAIEARLKKQYTALDTQLGSLTSSGNALSQALTSLANLNTSIANGR